MVANVCHPRPGEMGSAASKPAEGWVVRAELGKGRKGRKAGKVIRVSSGAEEALS